MDSSNKVHENTKGRFRTVVGVCLCCLILGFLLGVALDAKYRPNRILLYINADGKVSLSPKPGDIINFAAFDDETGANVKVSHTADLIPCDPKVPPPTCVYAPFTPGPDLYLFGCKSKDGTDCFDPQYGPKCPKCPGGQIVKGQFFVLFWHILWEDLEELLRISPVERRLPENQSGPSGGSAVSHALEAQEQIVSPPPPRVQEFVVACDKNGAPGVFPSGSADSIDTRQKPIAAEPSDTITWTLYPPAKSFTISPLDKACNGRNPSSDSPTCKVSNAGSYEFNLDMPDCASSTSTKGSLTVVKPTAAANAARP
jgi:hypothetical protein